MGDAGAVLEPFWKTARDLFRYKRLLAIAAGGALVSATCFGLGLGVLWWVLKLLLNVRQPAHDIIFLLITQSVLVPTIRKAAASWPAI